MFVQVVLYMCVCSSLCTYNLVGMIVLTSVAAQQKVLWATIQI